MVHDIFFKKKDIQFFNIHHNTAGFVENVEWDWNGTAHLSGWAKNFFTSTIPDDIIVTDRNGIIISSTKCNIPRKDVVDALKNENLYNSGWKLSIPKEKFDLKNIEDIFVYAYFLQENSAYALRAIQPVIDIDSKNLEEQLWVDASGLPPPDKSKPYYSCIFIEGGIIFSGNHDLNLCCILNLNSPKSSDTNLLGKSDPSMFSIKKILEKRKAIITQNQNEGYPLCQGCFLLRKKIWPYKKDLFNYLNLIHSTSCNLRCKFCGISNAMFPQGTPTEEVISCIQFLISKKYLARDSTIAISGGEPSMMKGLDSLLDLLITENFQISISSNGTIFSHSIANVIKKGKIANIIISVDAVNPEIYHSIKGKDFCKNVWENIGKYARIDRAKVIPKMIIMEENIDDIEPFIQKCKESGVSSIMYDYDQNIYPTEKILMALKFFKKCCNDNKIFDLPARPNIIELIS
jgi:organic radical activating enzyme